MKLNYIIIPLIVVLIAVIGGRFTAVGTSAISLLDGGGVSWYQIIQKPEWIPSGGIIGVVWTILFILGAISALIFWNWARRNRRFQWVIGIFILNAVINVLWSYLFFTKHLIGAAVFDAGALGVSVVALIILIWPVSRIASMLLIPYVGWVAFATYLNYVIWTLN